MAKKKPPQSSPAPASPGPSGNGDSLALMTGDNYTGPKLRGSVDLSTRAGKRLFVNSQNPPTFTPDTLKGKVFRIVHWLAEVRQFHDKETGEDRTAVSVTFVDPDSQTCRFGSEAITRALDVLRAMYGDGPWGDPLCVRISPYRTQNARNSYTLQEVDPDDVKREEQTW